MSVPVYRWALDVRLLKLVDRKDGVAARYTKADRSIDLTPFLGDGGAVSTTKTLRGEPSGAFSVSFGDQIEPSVRDTVYALVEPMDMIEIRASREPHKYAGKDLPLIMRGFVSSVRRSRNISDDTPQRGVVISGHDFGKLWMIHQVWQELATVTEQPVLTVFGLQAALGIKVAVMDIEEFMAEFVNKVMNPKIAKMAAFANRQIKPFVLETSVKEGRLIPNVISSMAQGPYWNIIAAVSDAPWNELFVRDEEDGPHLVFRPAPFKGLDGKLILQDAKDPGTVFVPDVQIVQSDESRTDSRIANFFWTPPGTSSLDTNQYATAGALIDGSALDFKHPNNAPELYGEKKMEAGTSLIPDDSKGQTGTQAIGDRPAEATRYVQWYRHRADQLQAMNRDNGVLEDGSLAVMGREDYVIGKYVRITEGDLDREAYVISVSHTLAPLGSWDTTLQVERGTGFLERNKAQGSPYYAEGRKGPYSK
ncbi:MAG TPA: hypothetical protein VGC15_13065 [Acetobacteraceae bacterium]